MIFRALGIVGWTIVLLIVLTAGSALALYLIDTIGGAR
jgi:hypothetical protein